MGSWRGHVTYFWNFGTPPHLGNGLRFFCRGISLHRSLPAVSLRLWLQVFPPGHLVTSVTTSTSCKSESVVAGISVRAPCYIITVKCLRSWCASVRCAVILSLSRRRLIRSQKPLVSGSISLLLSVTFAVTIHVHLYYSAVLNAGRSSQEKAVCLSVCQTRALWQNRRKVCPDFYTLGKII